MLDKAIEHGKEFRKPYRGSKLYARSCRNHGGCSFCERNRLHKFREKKYTDREIKEEVKDFNGYGRCSY